MWVVAILNYHILLFSFGLLPHCPERQPCSVQPKPTVSCCCCPTHWDVLRGMSCQKFLRDCNIFPFVIKTFSIFKIWGEGGLADNHKTVAIFLPLLFPAPPGAINKSREMCKAHLQCDSPEWPEFWADKDINSCKWSVLLICMQLQCRDQGKFKAIHCCWIPLRLGGKKKNLITFTEVPKMKSLF